MKNGRRTIPEIRVELARVAHELLQVSPSHAKEILALADETKRVCTKRRKPTKSARPITERLVADIRSYATSHPELSLWEIGVHFGVNQGRVSEIMHGFR